MVDYCTAVQRDSDILFTDVDLTFAASVQLFDTVEAMPLIPGGDTIAVTEENKELYLEALTQWLFRDRYRCIEIL